MHLYVISRGIKDAVDKWQQDMSAQYFKYKNNKVFPAKDNYEGWVQLAMRPIQLWEIVMPEENLQEVMRSLWNEHPAPLWKYKPGLTAIKTMLGAKKIPKMEKGQYRILRRDNVAIYPIGVKYDKPDDKGNEDL